MLASLKKLTCSATTILSFGHDGCRSPLTSTYFRLATLAGLMGNQSGTITRLCIQTRDFC